MHVTLREDIEKLTPFLRRYARALVAQEPDEAPNIADQLVQDALARAWRADWTRRTGDVKLFLYAAVANANRQRLRGRSSVQASAGQIAPSPAQGAAHSASHGAPQASGASTQQASGASAPSALSIPGAQRHGMTHALAAMSVEDREAFLLVVLEELNYADACDVLGIPRTTLIGRLVKARQKLGATLNMPGAAPPGRVRRGPAHLRVVK